MIVLHESLTEEPAYTALDHNIQKQWIHSQGWIAKKT